MGSGKGGSQQQAPTQTTSNVNQSNLPEYARPYFESLMNRAQQTSYQPYQPYTGDRIAGFTDAQNQSFQQVQDNVGSYQPYFNQANQGMQGAQQIGLGTSFDPINVNNSYTANSFTPEQWTDEGVAQRYMSPYQQAVTDIQTRESNRQFGIQGVQQAAQAAQAGALGGYRDAMVKSERFRNQNQLLNDIQATGLNNAYNTGLGQFNQDRNSLFTAAQYGNQNQQAQAQMDMAAQQANNQYGIAAKQLGLQGGQLGLSAAQGLAGLGQAQQQAGMADATALSNVGAMQQAQNQQGLDVAYQDFINQRDYDRQNLNWLSSILRGVPVSANSSTTNYQAPPSALSQIAGLGLGGVGLAKMFS
jgi:hypothetical protein